MDKVKFRAKTKDGLFEVITIDFCNGCTLIIDPDRANQKWYDWKDIEAFEQFTGLKDKNGKEIYEGDILKCENMVDRGDGYLDPYIGSVSYDLSQAYFIIASDEPFDGGYGFVDIDICEIIGNIHEH